MKPSHKHGATESDDEYVGLGAADTSVSATVDPHQDARDGFVQWVGELQQATNRLLYDLSQGSSLPGVVAWGLALYDFACMLSFAMPSGTSVRLGHMPTMGALPAALGTISLGASGPGTLPVATTTGLFYVVVAVGLFLGIVAGSSIARIMKGDSVGRQSGVARMLRLLIVPIPAGLVIPLAAMGFSPLSCGADGSFLNTSATCWSVGHAVLAFLGLLAASSFAAVGLIGALGAISRDPRSPDVLSRSHGRVQAIVLLAKLLLVAIFSQQAIVSPLLLVIASLLVGLLWVTLHLLYLPFYRITTTQLQVVLGGVHTWASLCALLAQIRDRPEDNVAAYVFFFALPFVLFMPYSLVDMRYRYFDGDVELSSVWLVEIKARRIMEAALQNTEIAGNAMRANTRTDAIGKHKSAEAKAGQVDTLRRVDALYADALKYFPSSSMLHLFIAQYLRIFRSNRHLEQSHLSAALGKRAALDESFFVYQRKQEIIDEDNASSNDRMNVLQRVRFEKYKAESQESGMLARSKLVEFWAELLEKHPNVTKLSALGTDIAEAMGKAEFAYQALLRINGRAVAVLRDYARFLIEVSNNPGKARRLVDDAEAIEDELSKEHADKSASFSFLTETDLLDANSENVAVVSASIDPARAGTIVSVNAACIKLMGYSRREVMGKNLAMLLPEPWGICHQRYLEHYLRTGKTTMMGTSRMLLVKHKLGHLIPALMSVRAMQEGFGGLFQQMRTEDNFAVVLLPSMLVTGVCPETAKMMGVTMKEVESSQVYMSRWIPDLPTDNRSHDDAMRAGRRFEVVRAMRAWVSARMGETAASRGSLGRGRARCAIWAALQDSSMVTMEGITSGVGATQLTEGMAAAMKREREGEERTAAASDGLQHVFVFKWRPLLDDSKSEASGSSRASRALRAGPATQVGRKLRAVVEDTPTVPGGAALLRDRSSASGSHVSFSRPALEETIDSPAKGGGMAGPIGSSRGDDADSTGAAEGSRAGSRSGSVAGEVPAGLRDGSRGKPGQAPSFRFADSKADDDTKPMPSAASVDSGSSASSAMQSLRKAVERQSVGTESGLTKLRSGLMLILLVASTLSVLSTATNRLLLASFTQAMDHVIASGRTLLHAQVAVIATEVLAFDALHIEDHGPGQREEVVAELVSAIEDFAVGHRRMYLAAASESAALQTLYTVPSLNMPVWDGTGNTERALSLLDAGAEFVSRGQVVMALNSSEFDPNLPAVQYMLQNGPADLSRGLNESIMLREELTGDLFQTIAFVQSTMMLGAVCIVLLLDLCVVGPILSRVESQKDGVWRVFLDVPQVVLRSMRSKCEKQLLVIQTEITESEDVDDDGGSEVGDVEGDFDEGLEGIDWSNTTFSSRSSRRFKKSWRVYCRLLLAFVGPTMLAVAYFAGTSQWSGILMTQAHDGGHMVLYSVQREAKANQVLFHTMNALTNLTHNDFIGEASLVNHHIEDLLFFEDILLHGSASMETFSSLKRYPELAALYLDNACGMDAEDLPANFEEECATFQDGLVATGLHATLQEYCTVSARLMRELVEQRLPPTAAARFDEHTVHSLEAMQHEYLAPGLKLSTDKLFSYLDEYVQEYLLWHLLLTIALCFSLLLSFFTLYRANISKLDQEVKRTRAMLLFFPEEVIRGVASIRDMISRIGGMRIAIGRGNKVTPAG